MTAAATSPATATSLDHAAAACTATANLPHTSMTIGAQALQLRSRIMGSGILAPATLTAAAAATAARGPAIGTADATAASLTGSLLPAGVTGAAAGSGEFASWPQHPGPSAGQYGSTFPQHAFLAAASNPWQAADEPRSSSGTGLDGHFFCTAPSDNWQYNQAPFPSYSNCSGTNGTLDILLRTLAGEEDEVDSETSSPSPPPATTTSSAGGGIGQYEAPSRPLQGLQVTLMNFGPTSAPGALQQGTATAELQILPPVNVVEDVSATLSAPLLGTLASPQALWPTPFRTSQSPRMVMKEEEAGVLVRPTTSTGTAATGGTSGTAGTGDGTESGACDEVRGRRRMAPPTLRQLDMEDMRRYFHLPSEAAAAALGCSRSMLKRRCRKLGMKRWPYRKVQSLMKLEAAVQEEDGLEEGAKENALKSIEKQLNGLLGDPDTKLDCRSVQYLVNTHQRLKRAAGATPQSGTVVVQGSTASASEEPLNLAAQAMQYEHASPDSAIPSPTVPAGMATDSATLPAASAAATASGPAQRRSSRKVSATLAALLSPRVSATKISATKALATQLRGPATAPGVTIQARTSMPESSHGISATMEAATAIGSATAVHSGARYVLELNPASGNSAGLMVQGSGVNQTLGQLLQPSTLMQQPSLQQQPMVQSVAAMQIRQQELQRLSMLPLQQWQQQQQQAQVQQQLWQQQQMQMQQRLQQQQQQLLPVQTSWHHQQQWPQAGSLPQLPQWGSATATQYQTSQYPVQSTVQNAVQPMWGLQADMQLEDEISAIQRGLGIDMQDM
eukprot:CAMPEP_0202902340 /NCGR_PEP_ID=MMETSP1392-20130828/16795_1 /ASSEMBLY_ACC=CAM_ASM_000868 /TAXON_ID=225041 /ORGANISM="Chlamydomonas chlamydogama, Strain SAG 11-48b" /LENGTH=788 /DNA_ID=CAMNT_0049589089 /DNA_START=500 /DNA_END=2866 /DNA_ORIENTATION=-